MADNVFRVTLHYTMLGQIFNNVLHFSGPSSDLAQMSALADEVQANWVDQCHFKQTRGVRYVAINVRLLESQFAPFTKTIAVDGTATQNSFDLTFSCHVIRIRTATAGRHGRGRVYIGGIESNRSTNGFVEQALVNQWNLSFGVWVPLWGPGGTSTFRLGVTRKVQPTANFNPMTHFELAPLVRSLHRRIIGIGI